MYNSAFLHGRHLCFGSHIGFEKCHPTILRSLWYPNSESTDNLLLTNIIHKSNFNYITAYTRTLCRGYITSTTKQSLIDFCTINWLFCSVLVVTASTTKLIRGTCQCLAQLFYCSFIAGVVTGYNESARAPKGSAHSRLNVIVSREVICDPSVLKLRKTLCRSGIRL